MRWVPVCFVIAACGTDEHTTDIQPTLHFADRSDAEIVRLLRAATGQDVAAVAATLEAAELDVCPAIVSKDGTHFLEGGCTNRTGDVIAGSATETKHQNDTMDATFDAWTITRNGVATSYDGRVAGSVYAEVNRFHAEADLTVTLDDVRLREELAYRCKIDEGCEMACFFTCGPQGSGLSLGDAGGALVEGTWRVRDGAGNGMVSAHALTLRGADTLVATGLARELWTITP